jgi:hypothetical protein
VLEKELKLFIPTTMAGMAKLCWVIYKYWNDIILVDNPMRYCWISKYIWNRILFRIRNWNRISQKDRGVGIKFWNLDLFSYEKWRGLGAGTVDCD